MKSKIYYLLLLCCSIFVFAMSSCDDDRETLYQSYGNIVGTQGNYSIHCDNGSILNVMNPNIGIPIKDGMRVYVVYEADGNEKENSVVKTYDVRVHRLLEILSKAPVLKSFIDLNFEVRNDSIGHDPINVYKTWFGGKYLNINFDVLRSQNNIAHFINLVYDDSVVPARGDTAYVELRHNKMGDAGYFFSQGLVSFDLTKLLPEGKTSRPIKLLWTNYDGQKKTDTGTFELK